MNRTTRLLAAVSIVASMAASPAMAQPGAAPAGDAEDAVRAAIEAERQALIALGELEPEDEGPACDRECLHEIGQDYLDSVQTGDLSRLVLAQNVRITQDGQEIGAGEGYWRGGGALRQHRLNILDPYWQVAAGLAVMDNALLAYRLKVEDGVIYEIETFVVEPDDDGATLARETLAEPRAEFLRRVDPAEQNSRTELVQIAQYYPDGLRAGSFEEVDAPFAEGAERLENGMILAGPRCTLNENCLDMKAQPSPERPTLRQRLLAVDELQGIVFMWLDWEQQSGATLEVFEAFKIYAGHIHAVEAFIKNDDPANYPGWPMEDATDLQ